MTIITKPFSSDAKKAEDKVILPLFDHNATQEPSAPSLDGSNMVTGRILIFQRQRRMPNVTPLILLITLAAASIGIGGGIYLFQTYARSPIDRIRYHGFCRVPYSSVDLDENLQSLLKSHRTLIDSDASDDFLESTLDDDISKFFREELDIEDNEEQEYTKINVPDFRDGRRGQFMHDFKANMSVIIDLRASRCFVLPLDRETVLPPQSFQDLITKMYSGFYDIDTSVIRQNMRVITPEMTDLSSIGARIAEECQNMKVYQLEKIVGGIVKRSAELHESGKFAEFAGKNIVEIDIVNINELNESEKPV